MQSLTLIWHMWAITPVILLTPEGFNHAPKSDLDKLI